MILFVNSMGKLS